MARKRETPGLSPGGNTPVAELPETTASERLAEILGLDADELARWAKERSLFTADKPLPALDFVRELVLTEMRRAGLRGVQREVRT